MTSSVCSAAGVRPSAAGVPVTPGRRCGRVDVRRRAAQQQRERQHRDDHEDRDAEVRRAPARGGDEVRDHRRPHGAREVVAAREDAERHAAPLGEPQRHVREQRRERRGSADADEEAVRERVLHEASRPRRARVARAERERAEDHRHHDPVAVGHLAHRRCSRCRSRSWSACTGSDASARATPNSACTAGSATTTAHIPTPPMVDSTRPTTRRYHE